MYLRQCTSRLHNLGADQPKNLRQLLKNVVRKHSLSLFVLSSLGIFKLDKDDDSTLWENARSTCINILICRNFNFPKLKSYKSFESNSNEIGFLQNRFSIVETKFGGKTFFQYFMFCWAKCALRISGIRFFYEQLKHGHIELSSFSILCRTLRAATHLLVDIEHLFESFDLKNVRIST